jgi:hypothetical protein
MAGDLPAVLNFILMEKKYYTKEGSAYILKMASAGTNAAAVAGLSSMPIVFFNPDPTTVIPANTPGLLTIGNSNKKIIPVSCNYGVLDTATGAVIINNSAVYFNYTSQASALGTIVNNNGVRALSKIIPYVTMNYFTSNVNYSFSCNYERISFADEDFIDPNNASFVFKPTIVNAIVGSVFAYSTGDNTSIAAGTYDGNITLLYFEMV